jgi:ubiquinone/menaquinone biosynthesis C-methylase UbiE
MIPQSAAIERQRKFYDDTSSQYDVIHSHDTDEHGWAFGYMSSMLGQLAVTSVLDVGSGTGFALLKLRQRHPEIHSIGIEPSAAQRRAGHQKGLSEADLIEGDATALPFSDQSFDLVCEFGALHHMPSPDLALVEMLRVARKAIFICDTNNFGQGGPAVRFVKQTLNSLGLWPLANWLKTFGKGYAFAEGDGIFYPYSVFSNYKLIRTRCREVHVLGLKDSTPNLYKSASHVALLGIKQ